MIFLRHFKEVSFLRNRSYSQIPVHCEEKVPSIQKKLVPFDEFKNKIKSFDQWKYEVKTKFPNSTEESLIKIYETHTKSLYKLYTVCYELEPVVNQSQIKFNIKKV
jgi:hypothetical protein